MPKQAKPGKVEQPEELVTVAVRLPKSLARRLKIAAASTDKSQQDLAAEAIQAHLDKLKL